MNEEEKNIVPTENITTEAPTTNMPTESAVLEEPVMIAANIDEIPPEDLASMTTPVTVAPTNPVTPQISEMEISSSIPPQAPPVINIPENMPDLGNKETETKEETVPAFQQIPTVEGNTITEEKTEIEKPERLVDRENSSFVENSTNPINSYQAKSLVEPEAPFQQLPEIQDNSSQTEEYVDEDDYEEEPKKRGKIIALIIIGIVIIAVVAVGFLGLRTRGNRGEINLLRPERSADSNINIAILGDSNTPNAQVVATIVKKLGQEKTIEELEKCPAKETYKIKYNLHVLEIKSNNNIMNINYACTKESSINYLLVSEGNQTIDGAIIVVSANSGVTQEINDYLATLNKTGINRLLVYIIEDGDVSKAKTDMQEALKKNELDNENTPIITGSSTDEEKMETLISKSEKWIKKETLYKQPAAVQSYKTMSLLTYFISDSKSKTKLTLTINKVDYKAKVTLEEGHDNIKEGDRQNIEIELPEEIPVVKGMRVMIKENDNIIGIGVISDLK